MVTIKPVYDNGKIKHFYSNDLDCFQATGKGYVQCITQSTLSRDSDPVNDWHGTRGGR